MIKVNHSKITVSDCQINDGFNKMVINSRSLTVLTKLETKSWKCRHQCLTEGIPLHTVHVCHRIW